MAFKFTYFHLSFNNVYYFSDIYNSTQYLQTDLLLTVDINKQYLVNNNDDIYLQSNTQTIFEDKLLSIGNSFQDMIMVK